MDTYSIKDADFLVDYYSLLVQDEKIDKSILSKIKTIQKLLVDGNRYRVVVKAKTPRSNLTLTQDILAVAKELNLPLPVEVLKQRDQHL